MKLKPLPSLDLLEKHFLYDKEGGKLFAKIAWGHRRVGEEVGSVSNAGYILVALKGVKYLTHRLIWKMHYGEEPRSIIDHINGIRTDNRISNLRQATWSLNSANSKKRSNCQVPYKGVSRNGNCFAARIFKDGKVTRLGYFRTPEEAHAAYVAASKEMFGEYSNDGNDEALIAFRQSRMSGREQARELSRSLKANGFTLIELLLVMLAMFCLGTVAIIAYARALGCTP